MPDDNRRAKTFPLPVKIQPKPNPEEVAVIAAALETLSEAEPEGSPSMKRSRWRLASLLGHAVEPNMTLEGSLWSSSRWKGST
jgi:hypothetical protein